MRLIDADDLAYDSIDSEDTNRHAYYYGTGIMAVRKEDIDAMPTIELPERKKGKWIKNSPVTMKCNQCEFVIKDWDWHRFKYCPNCGARMVK